MNPILQAMRLAEQLWPRRGEGSWNCAVDFTIDNTQCTAVAFSYRQNPHVRINELAVTVDVSDLARDSVRAGQPYGDNFRGHAQLAATRKLIEALQAALHGPRAA